MKTKILLIILAVNVLSVYTQNTIESGTLRAASNSYVPNSVEIDKYNKEVGEISFTSAVTQTGAMTYTIPIEIYPGIKDMHPQLALSYNHLSGNGLLGVGWNLSGLSSISRTSNNLYYNNLVQPVNLTTSDAFVLDGMRLIKVDESTNQIKYESEQGNIKVTAFLNGNIVKYFEVYYPTGRKGVYGYTSNAANKLQYPLTSLTDLYGNLITYAYTEQSNHYLLTNIIYYNRQIDFQYESRPDNISFYSAGLNMLENKRLKNIICRYSSSILRTYSLTYETQKNSSVLTQIDCSASGRFLNPLKFYYGTNNNATNYLTSSTSLPSPYYHDTKSENMIVKVGKFDRSEDVDALIVYPRKSPYVLLPAPVTGQANQKYRNGYDDISTEKIFLYTGMNTSPATSNPALTIGEGFIDMLSADIDGQYGDEVIKINDIISGNNEQLSFTVYAKGIYGFEYRYTRTYSFPAIVRTSGGPKSVHPKFYYTGDFNGDGKMEVLAVSIYNPLWDTNIASKCYLFDLNTGAILYEGHLFDFHKSIIDILSDRLYVSDFDGDGKSEICLIDGEGTSIYKFNVSGSAYSLQQLPGTYTGLKKSDWGENRQLLLGELNGDGKPDFLLSPPYTNSSDHSWKVFYSKGNGDFNTTFFQSANNEVNNDYVTQFMLQDVNGDGLTDLIKYFSNNIYTYLVKDDNKPSLNYENVVTVTSNSILAPVDINNYNYFGKLLSLKDGTVTKYGFPRNDTQEKLLTGIVSSLGIVQKIYYQTLDDRYTKLTENEQYIYTQGSTSGINYPNVIFNGHIFVPGLVEQYFKGQKNESLSYTYTGGVVHKQGLGFRGFRKVTTYDNIRRREAVQEYEPLGFGIMASENTPVSTNTYYTSVDIGTDKRVKIRPSGLDQYDKLTGVTVSTSFNSYDSYGNPTSIYVDYGDGVREETSLMYYNNANESAYLLGFLRDKIKTTIRNGVTYQEQVYISSHDNKGSPIERKNYINNNQVSLETFGYDSRGFCTQKSVKSYTSANTLTTWFEYNSYGQLAKETNPLNMVATYIYNDLGRLSAAKDHRDRQTNYGYNNFGRLWTVSYPDGTSETSSYTWDIPETNGLYCVTTSVTGKPTGKTYYDALGRETRSSVVQFNGTESHTQKQYDTYGRLQKVSLPFTGSSASFWNTYNYCSDNSDRLQSIVEASGRRTSYSYSETNVTETKDGMETTRKYDNSGHLKEVNDPGGTVTYNLRPDGQPSSVVAPGNITTSFEYDNYARKWKIHDPSAGTQTFEYDAAGNLYKEINANNQTITYTYDIYNRLTGVARPELTTGYNYDGPEKRLAAVASAAGTKSYTYDAYGRISTENTQVVSGKSIKKTYGYSNGNVSSIQYTSQNGVIGTENYIYSNGYLSEIKFGTTSIWKLNAVNAAGQPTSVNTGNISRGYGYDNYGYPTNRSATDIQNFQYVFDPLKGNLTSRKDNSRNLQESFLYDNLNRLQIYPGGSADYDLQGKGNIIKRNETGSTFYYNTPNKPYAISGVTTTSNAIPLRNQSVTYTSFHRPATISENDYTASFIYGNENERIRMELKNNGSKVLTRYYLEDCYEIDDRSVGGLKEKLYLGGDYYSAPAVYVKDGGIWQMHYVFRDHLGSITHITNSSGSVVQELSYDAWGRLRNPANQQAYAPGLEPELFLGRGYTGHEHLPQFGLINMNARLYDPAVGRFLSPDPYVQMPDFTQNFNRYSYCLNNPVRYTDPTGEYALLDDLIVAFLGGTVNVIVNWGNIHSFGQGLSYFGVGAAGTWAGLYGGPVAAGAIIGAGNNFVTQGFGANGTWNWGNIHYDQVLMNGLIGAGMGFIGGQVSGLIGPQLSKLTSGLGGQAFQQCASQGLTGAGTGFVLGTGSALLNGEEFGDALSIGGKNALSGFAIGSASGLASGLRSAYKAGENPWTGKSNTQKDYSVYQGFDENGDVRYVGITERDPQIRFDEHLNSGTERANLRYEAIGSGLSKTQARIMEQNYINQYGMQKNGGMLYNKINSIAPKYWGRYGISW